MKFLQRLFKWDADATAFDKVATVFFALFGIFCMGWLIVASYGIGRSDLAQAHTAGHGFSETLFASVLYAAAGFWAYVNFSEKIPFKVNDMVVIIGLLILIVLGVNANTGFFAHVY